MKNFLNTVLGNSKKLVEPKKTTNELIAEIHETFNTEVDRLLLEAGILKPLPDVDKEIISKSERLKSLGFNNTSEVKKGNEYDEIESKVQQENDKKNELKEVIEYFSNKYPLYKFITEDSVKKICAKYNLVYGGVSNYIGKVPDKNLVELENFKIDKYDELWIVTRRGAHYMDMDSHGITSYKYVEKYKNDQNRDPSIRRSKAPLEIAAPLKDFDTKNMVVSNFKLDRKIEIPDPVVLCPVIYNYNKYYLIVTAWGEEASDELVRNEKFN